jgi:hypothetical protein
MTPAEQYLLDYLIDEFRKNPEVRIKAFDENQERGVIVRTEAREYFFPYAWMEKNQFSRVQKQVQKIREVVPEQML